MSAARGTRRPHARRPRPRPRKPSRSKKGGCDLFLLAWAVIILLAGYGLWWLALAGGQLVAYALAAAIGGTP